MDKTSSSWEFVSSVSPEQRMAYRGHLLTENCNGLVVATLTTRAYGSAEGDAALADG